MKKKRIILAVILLILFLLLCSCSKRKSIDLDQLKLPEKGEEVIVMKTDLGIIRIRLFPNVAPKAVENFKGLTKKGYFDGQSFYRVRKDYFIQSGDPTGEGKYGESIWGDEFEDEFSLNYRHFYGALSMANSGPNTNTSNFFIVQGNDVDNDIIELMKEIGEEGGYTDEVIKAYETLGGVYDLDNKHTVFGQVFEGMDVVDAIANTEIDTVVGQPIKSIVIEKVELVSY
ncbi:peptidylprolyl isomerase [Tissierella pigra]|uniref:Peptidyl-prolyl cis-trans isomerase n=1 Tax=Tissierella pigra TaxID=2607614 RepID=A0A6N7XHT4_9FIRM|nr:peptidylprolyl isomerase [Tissierella pigra]MBU5425833.1 peptidylprolyl isomerase [Tissierella pigra]MSU01589.1 peptidylprolyl isomerase [Tissierella pigra]